MPYKDPKNCKGYFMDEGKGEAGKSNIRNYIEGLCKDCNLMRYFLDNNYKAYIKLTTM